MQVILSAICLKVSTIPENSVFQDIIDGGNLKEETRYTLSGEAYNSVEITTDNSELPVIYLPATGYVEGEAFRNVTHVSLWTRTLLSGNQGFDTHSVLSMASGIAI